VSQIGFNSKFYYVLRRSMIPLEDSRFVIHATSLPVASYHYSSVFCYYATVIRFRS